MEVLGFRDSSPASIILQYIQREGKATIRDLEHVLGVSTTAVREHLAYLQANGFVATSTMRYGPGRPRLVYTLTDKAQDLFPKHYDLLIRLMLAELAQAGGPELVERVLNGVGDRLSAEYRTHVNGRDVQQRLDGLCDALETRGIAAAVAPANDRLHIHSCPYFGVAQHHSEVCTMERRMFEHVLGEELTLEQTIREGHHSCCFVVQQAEKAETRS